jgi:hypothetical protein
MNTTSKKLLMRHAMLAVVALALPCGSALAETMDVVHTRGVDANTDGRSGGITYVDNRDAAIDAQQSQAAAAAWEKTKAETASAWDHTKAFVAQPPTIRPDEPQRYGRAGGFIGVEEFEVPQPGVTALHSAPANADAVKTGEAQWGYTDRASAASPADRSTQTGTAPSHEESTPASQN